MKKLAIIISAIILLSTFFGCSVDTLDISSNISEEVISVESVVSQLVEETISESSEEVSSQHQHAFSEATCTQPKTCECGETEGNTLEHDWEKATCKTLKTCSVCGITEGEYAEHQWKEATCSKASTCTLCSKTTGEPKSHTYSSGKCTSCGVKDPNYTQSEQMVWIPTISGKKYHSNSSCSNMNGPRQVTISEARRLGYTACKKCY